MYQHFKNCKKIAERRFSNFSLQDWKDICTFALWKSKRPPACSRRWLFSQCEDASTLHSEIKKLQVEGQDEDVDDFPSTKVHRRCKKTKSPILLRSKPIVKPILQWALNGRTDYERQTFISLLLQYLQSKAKQTKLTWVRRIQDCEGWKPDT